LVIYIGEISKKYVYNAHPETGNTSYIDKRIFFKYAIGIIKPFVLAYGRLNVLKQIKQLEQKGFDVLYCHTDSIITNADKSYFDIGTNS
jgi:DNA polymerase elongation subunit (family B)